MSCKAVGKEESLKIFLTHKRMPQLLNHAKERVLAHLYSRCGKRDSFSPLSLGDVLHEEVRMGGEW